jgi:uncharacterized membrane protein YphA (DoxX/SURF4 family)
MKPKMVFYWITTILIALETFAGGFVDLTHGQTDVFNGPRVADVVTSLGYPVYVLAILGILKIPGAITIVVPGFLRLKEWAYAGIVFELSAAAVSHAVCGHRSEIIAPWSSLVSRWRLGRFDLPVASSEPRLLQSSGDCHHRDGNDSSQNE